MHCDETYIIINLYKDSTLFFTIWINSVKSSIQRVQGEYFIFMQTIPFIEFGLSNPIMQAIDDIGYEEPTPIQAAAIPLLMRGKDVIGQSQTGTGKTAAFAIPAIERLLADREKGVQVLILCPTRELAIQACDEIRKLTRHIEWLHTAAVYGGQDIERQIKQLRMGVQIVVGTPGRIMDHMRRHTLWLGNVKTAILDEADEMLSMGFRDDIETIFADVPQERQTVLFSATMSPEIMEITKLYMNSPEIIRVVRKELTVPAIDQYYYNIPHSHKMEALSRLMDVYHPEPAMIFCNTKKQVDELVSAMQQRGYVAEGLHGDMKQRARDHVMNTFRGGKVDMLIATDVAARGIDISDIGAVFNYDIPQDVEYYVHRIGRTGRAGKSGLAFTFVTGSREMAELRGIMKYTRSEITKGTVPTTAQVMECRKLRFARKVCAAVENEDLSEYIHMVEQLSDEGISPVEIAAALLKSEMTADGRTSMPSESDDFVFAGHERRCSRNASGNAERRDLRDGRKNRRFCDRDRNMVSIYINLGSSAGISPKHIVGAVANEAGLPGRSIGRIEISDRYSTFDVPQESAETVINALNKTRLVGRRVNARLFNEQY